MENGDPHILVNISSSFKISNILQECRGCRVTWDLREEHCCLLLSHCVFLLWFPPMKITTSCWVFPKRPVLVKFGRLSKSLLSRCIRIKTQWVASLLRGIKTPVCHLLLLQLTVSLCRFRIMKQPMTSSWRSIGPMRCWRMKTWGRNMTSMERRGCKTNSREEDMKAGTITDMILVIYLISPSHSVWIL